MRLRLHTARRSAFTLIELLVVIVIIIILMGMLMAAVQKVFVLLDETKTTTELSRMTEGADSFRTSLGSHPPSRIILIERPTNTVFYDSGNPLHMYSVDTLRRLFPGIYICIDPPSGSNPAGPGHDWNGDGTITDGEFMNMEGDESFVYFMNGVPTVDANGVIGGQGFCTDKITPTFATPGRNRIGPFHEFKTDRLVRVPRLEQFPNNANNTRTRQVILYRDIWNTPYAYFLSRYSTQNSYPCVLIGSASNDCPTLTGVMAPYWHTQTGNFRKFHRADSFQIISAGRDATFFEPIPTYTGRFDPANPEQYLTMAERDNFTNFHSGALAPR